MLLKLYLQQRNLMIEDEMISALDSLYNKVVPTGVRDFIDMRAGLPKPAERKRNQELMQQNSRVLNGVRSIEKSELRD